MDIQRIHSATGIMDALNVAAGNLSNQSKEYLETHSGTTACIYYAHFSRQISERAAMHHLIK